MIRPTLLIGLLSLCVLTTGRSQDAAPHGLSAKEAEIVAKAGAGMPQFAADLQEAVNTSSATEDLAGVERMGAIVVRQMSELGFNARWVPQPAGTGRAGCVVAEHRGTRGKRILIIGHLDTVYPGGNFRLEGGRAFGSGTSDMKGGNLVAIHALRSLRAAGALEGTQIIAVFSGDEESPGRPLAVVRSELIEAAKRSDVALAFEAAVNDTVVIARRGSMKWTLATNGVSAHSSGIFSPDVGDGAIYETSRILNSFREELRDEDGLTFNAALVAGGATASLEATEAHAKGKANITPGEAFVLGDLRAIDQNQVDRVKARMAEIVSRNLPHTTAKITFGDDAYPPMAATQENYALLAQIDQVSRDLGYGGLKAFDPRARGAGDVSFVAPFIPGLDGLGIRGEMEHNPGESADLASVPELVKRTAILIYRLTR